MSERISLDRIRVPEGRRRVREDAVSSLSESIKTVGLLNPIVVRWAEEAEPEDGFLSDVAVLVAGAHRLEAVRRLGWTEVDAVEIKGSEIDARLAEIAENLHRAELTALERSEQIAEWVRLTEAQFSRPSDAKIGRGRPEGGVRAASRKLGIAEATARRSIDVASLSDEAKAEAIATGADRKATVLREAAAKPTAAEQVATIRLAAAPLNDDQSTERQVARLMSAWNAAGADARAEFLARIDTPVFDRGAA